VALKLYESCEAAEAAHRKGLMRLFMLANSDKVKYLKKNLPGIKTACLHYVTIGKCEELIASIITAAVEHSLFDTEELPRSEKAYQVLAQQARTCLVDNAGRIAALVAEALSAFHRINKLLKGAVQPQWLNSIADIRDQLEHLLAPGFAANTPLPWLEQMPRYMQALERRLEKLRSDPERDRRLLLEMQPLWQRYWARCEQASQCRDEALQRFRWLLEELRVSLFAQELGTIETVSVPRLEKQWKGL